MSLRYHAPIRLLLVAVLAQVSETVSSLHIRQPTSPDLDHETRAPFSGEMSDEPIGPAPPPEGIPRCASLKRRRLFCFFP